MSKSILLDAEGHLAKVGTCLGFWLDDDDFVVSGGEGRVTELGPHAFPRDWPAVYGESEALRSLLRKRGPCAAQRVSVVPNLDLGGCPIAAELARSHLSSLSVAEAVRESLGHAVVEGWAIYDLLESVTGAAFVAERYWWNAEGGAWLDFSPRPEGTRQLLLAEAAAPRRRKTRALLSQRHLEVASHLLRLRFPSLAAELRGAPEDVAERLEAADLAELSGRLASGGSAPTLRLLSLRGAPGAAELAVAVSGLGNSEVAEAAVALGRLCHDRGAQLAAGARAVERSVALLRSASGRALEAGCYALWQLQVGNREHAQAALAASAFEPLLQVLAARSHGGAPTTSSAQLQAAGALMCLAAAPRAQDVLGEAGAIEVLCAFILRPGAEEDSAEASAYAAAALGDLLHHHDGNCARASSDVDALLSALVRVLGRLRGSLPAVVCACALASLARAGTAPSVVSSGAFEALAEVLGEASRPSPQVLAALANLARQLPTEAQVSLGGAAECAVSALGSGCATTRLCAAALCANLAPHAPTRPALLKAGVVGALLRALGHPDPELRGRAAGALGNLVDHAETLARVALEAPDLARRLLYAMQTEYHSGVRRSLARTLAMVASRQSDAVGRGASELAAALEEHAAEMSVALMNLAAAPAQRRRMLDAGVVPSLVAALSRAASQRSHGHTAGALANLLVGSKEACDAAAAGGAAEALALLLPLARAEPRGLAYLAAAVGHLADLGPRRVRAALAGSAATLVDLLRAEEQHVALFALSALATTQGDVVREALSSADAHVSLARLRQRLATEKSLVLCRLCDRADALLRLLGGPCPGDPPDGS